MECSNTTVQLCDGRGGIRSAVHIEAREPAQGEVSADAGRDQPILDFVSSDATLDRYQEIIDPTGWKLSSYLRNPVFQNAHQYGDILFTLGRALITEVRPVAGRPVLYQRILFATEANPVARIAYPLYRDGFLKTVSVGFIPIKWEEGSRESGFRRKYVEQELLEVSAVAIPANPNALVLALKAGSLQKADLQDTLDLLRHLTTRKPARPCIEPLLAQARELRDLLRHS